MTPADYDRLLTVIRALLDRQTRVIAAIDGRCGAGKSTLAAQLQAQLSCRVFHMDDFFLRPEQRTAARQNNPQSPVWLPREIKHFRLQHCQCRFRTNCGHQAGNKPKHGELTPQCRAQQFFSRTECAPYHQLLMTLAHSHLHLCQQQQHTAGGDQHHHHLQRPTYLLQHLTDLF